jgi:hypothetical protein
MTSCLNYTSFSQLQNTRGGTKPFIQKKKSMAENIEQVTIYQAMINKKVNIILAAFASYLQYSNTAAKN